MSNKEKYKKGSLIPRKEQLSRFAPRAASLSFAGYQCVGHVKFAHGIKGEVFVHLEARRADWLAAESPPFKYIYLLRSGGKQELEAWPVVSCRPHKQGLILEIEGIVTRNQSEAFKGSLVYISEDLLQAQPGEPIFLRQILNFTVCDSTGKGVGKVVGFASNGPQDLLRLKPDGPHERPEVLIPFIDEFLLNIDFDNKRVTMDLPPGLVDLDDL